MKNNVIILCFLHLVFCQAQNNRQSQDTLLVLQEREHLHSWENGIVFNNTPIPVFIVNIKNERQVYSRVYVGNSVYGPILRNKLKPYDDGLFHFETDSGTFSLDIYSNRFISPPKGYDPLYTSSGNFPITQALLATKNNEPLPNRYVFYPDSTRYGPFEKVLIVTPYDTRESENYKYLSRFSGSWDKSFWYKNRFGYDNEPIDNKKRFIYHIKDEVFFFNNGEIHGPFKKGFIRFREYGKHWALFVSEGYGKNRNQFYYTSQKDIVQIKDNAQFFYVFPNGNWGGFDFEKGRELKYNIEDSKKHYTSYPPIGNYVDKQGKKIGPLFYNGEQRFGDTIILYFKPVKTQEDTATGFIHVDIDDKKNICVFNGEIIYSNQEVNFYYDKNNVLIKNKTKQKLYFNKKKVASWKNGDAGLISNRDRWYAFSNRDSSVILKTGNNFKKTWRKSHIGIEMASYNSQGFAFYLISRNNNQCVYLSAVDSTFQFTRRLKYQYTSRLSGNIILSKNAKHFAIAGDWNFENIYIDGIEFQKGFALCYRHKEDAFFWISIEGNAIVLNRYDCKDL